MRQISKSMFIAVLAAVFMTASAANALITVSNSASAVIVNPGDIFTVDINVAYDGAPAGLTGIFTGVTWDTSVLTLQSSTAAPFAILFGGGGFLSKLADPSSFPGDPAGTLRTVQYGAAPGQFGGPGASLITTLTFQAAGAGDGTVVTTFLLGDGIFGAGGAAVDPADLVFIDSTTTVIPEPGTALLMGLGLAGLGAAGRRKS